MIPVLCTPRCVVQEGTEVVSRTLNDQLRVTVNPEVEVHPQVT